MQTSCKNCGTALDDNMEICPKCGQTVQQESSADKHSQNPKDIVKAQYSADYAKMLKLTLVKSIVAIVLIVALIVAPILTHKNNNNVVDYDYSLSYLALEKVVWLLSDHLTIEKLIADLGSMLTVMIACPAILAYVSLLFAYVKQIFVCIANFKNFDKKLWLYYQEAQKTGIGSALYTKTVNAIMILIVLYLMIVAVTSIDMISSITHEELVFAGGVNGGIAILPFAAVVDVTTSCSTYKIRKKFGQEPSGVKS